MENLTPRREDLEPIEYASRDEISALQLKRMKQSIRHACENSPFFCKIFDEAGIHPNDLKQIDAPLESLPACYSFVQIATGTGKRAPQQRAWRLNEQQQWGMANAGC